MKVKFDDLETALLSSSAEISNWVDRKTGRIIFIGDESVFGDVLGDDEERKASREILILCGEIENDDKIEIEENRYVLITPPHSSESFKVMEEFTLDLDEKELQTQLFSALGGYKPFRRFKDVLLDYPDERENWFAFESQKLREFIEDWAKSEQIEIDFEKNDS